MLTTTIKPSEEDLSSTESEAIERQYKTIGITAVAAAAGYCKKSKPSSKFDFKSVVETD